jgi:hypothetical protein
MRGKLSKLVFSDLRKSLLEGNARGDHVVQMGVSAGKDTFILTLFDFSGLAHTVCRRFGLARTYASREGDMSWGQLGPVHTDNL